MTADEFNGRWVRKGGVLVPVVDVGPPKVLCKVCGSPAPAALCRPCRESDRKRVHGSHAGYAQHVRRNEPACWDCRTAELAYQRARYTPGRLSAVDREWCEKAAVKGSWMLDTQTNRCASVANTTT